MTSATALEARSAPSSPTAASSRSASSPTRCTRAPSATKSRAVASPIPLSPPVIRATLFSSRAIRAIAPRAYRSGARVAWYAGGASVSIRQFALDGSDVSSLQPSTSYSSAPVSVKPSTRGVVPGERW